MEIYIQEIDASFHLLKSDIYCATKKLLIQFGQEFDESKNWYKQIEPDPTLITWFHGLTLCKYGMSTLKI